MVTRAVPMKPTVLGNSPTWRMLDTFSLDDLPMFSRTVLTSSPVLVLPNRDGAPLEAGSSFRGSFMSSSNRQPPVSLVRQSSSTTSAVAVAEEFPPILQLLVRLHKREAFNLFRKWEADGLIAVPIEVFAEGVRKISGERLSDDDLLTVLKIIEPVRGDEVLVGERWRSRTLDCKRLWRKLSGSAARAASRYIRESNSPERTTARAAGGGMLSRSGEFSPPSPKGAVSWSKMLEQRGADSTVPMAPVAFADPPTMSMMSVISETDGAPAAAPTAPPPLPAPVRVGGYMSDE